MILSESTMSQQIAEAARAFQLQVTGHAPAEVSVVLGEDTLVITLHGALTRAEQAMAASSAGAAQVQEFHRKLFANSSEALLDEIRRITGVRVLDSATAIEPAAGGIVHVFTTGSMVQVFHLSRRTPDAPSGTAPAALA